MTVFEYISFILNPIRPAFLPPAKSIIPEPLMLSDRTWNNCKMF